MWVKFNPNPINKRVGDCVIRAICKTLGKPWDTVYLDLAEKGFALCDMPSSNAVWNAYLKDNGYMRYPIPNTCPDCYTVKDFCEDHPNGEYILATGSHVVAVNSGNYFDTWDSGDEVPIYFFTKGVL